MRDRYLPLAEVRVAVWPDVAGFAAVVEDHLAALFVAPERQGRGGAACWWRMPGAGGPNSASACTKATRRRAAFMNAWALFPNAASATV